MSAAATPALRSRFHALKPLRDASGAAGHIIGLGVAIACGLLAAYVAVRLRGIMSANFIRSFDFMTYYSSFRLVLDGHAGQVYDLHTLGHAEASVIGAAYSVIPYLYPPYFALIFAPLAVLPFGLSFLFWLVFNCVLLSLSLYFLQTYAHLSGRAATAFRVAAISFLPVFLTLILGQSSILLLACLTVALVSLRSGRDTLAGVMLAFAILKPPYAAAVVLVLLARGQWRALYAFAIATFSLLAAPIPIFGLSIDRSWLDFLLNAGSWQGHGPHFTYQHVPISPALYQAQWNHSFTGFAQLLLPSQTANMARLAAGGLAILALLWCARRSALVDIPFGLALVVGLLVSPHALGYDLSLMLIPVAVTLRFRSLGPPGLRVFLITCYVMATVGYRLAFAVPIQLSVIATSALALWLLLLSGERPADREQTAQPPAPIGSHYAGSVRLIDTQRRKESSRQLIADG